MGIGHGEPVSRRELAFATVLTSGLVKDEPGFSARVRGVASGISGPSRHGPPHSRAGATGPNGGQVESQRRDGLPVVIAVEFADASCPFRPIAFGGGCTTRTDPNGPRGPEAVNIGRHNYSGEQSMRTSPGRHRRNTKRWWIAVLAAVTTALAITTFGIGPAQAVHDTGAFELDGNATNGAAPGDDWDNVCHQVTKTATTPLCTSAGDTNGATAVDWVAEPNLNATIFTGGGSKDPQDVNQWAWKDGAGGLPDKDNLLHSFAARYPTSEGQVLFFGSDRLDNSGDAQQGFWFFQNQIGLVGTSSGSFSG